MLFEFINPSDKYTFIASSIEIAGVVALNLGRAYGARCLDPGNDESTPVLFGWSDWLEERGLDKDWSESHLPEIADAMASFLIGSAEDRIEVEAALAEIPAEKHEAWLAARHDRRRSSMNDIGSQAHHIAKRIRERIAKEVSA